MRGQKGVVDAGLCLGCGDVGTEGDRGRSWAGRRRGRWLRRAAELGSGLVRWGSGQGRVEG